MIKIEVRESNGGFMWSVNVPDTLSKTERARLAYTAINRWGSRGAAYNVVETHVTGDKETLTRTYTMRAEQ